jgi:hypothetical protein
MGQYDVSNSACASIEAQVVARIMECCVLSESTQNEITTAVEAMDVSGRINQKASACNINLEMLKCDKL